MEEGRQGGSAFRHGTSRGGSTPKWEADRGRVAVERGPLVYCAEVARQ